MKVLFQMLYKEKFNRDEQLPELSRRRWNRWLQDLQEVHRVLVPRYIDAGSVEEITSDAIHGFGDALERKAYCVEYEILETSDRHYPVLLLSKTRLAALTRQFELLSGEFLARLLSSVKESLESRVQIDKTNLWLDSRTAVCWKSPREWKQFVHDRVNQILSLIEAPMCSHCPGVENPEDVGSRG